MKKRIVKNYLKKLDWWKKGILVGILSVIVYIFLIYLEYKPPRMIFDSYALLVHVFNAIPFFILPIIISFLYTKEFKKHKILWILFSFIPTIISIFLFFGLLIALPFQTFHIISIAFIIIILFLCYVTKLKFLYILITSFIFQFFLILTAFILPEQFSYGGPFLGELMVLILPLILFLNSINYILIKLK